MTLCSLILFFSLLYYLSKHANTKKIDSTLTQVMVFYPPIHLFAQTIVTNRPAYQAAVDMLFGLPSGSSGLCGQFCCILVRRQKAPQPLVVTDGNGFILSHSGFFCFGSFLSHSSFICFCARLFASRNWDWIYMVSWYALKQKIISCFIVESYDSKLSRIKYILTTFFRRFRIQSAARFRQY